MQYVRTGMYSKVDKNTVGGGDRQYSLKYGVPIQFSPLCCKVTYLWESLTCFYMFFLQKQLFSNLIASSSSETAFFFTGMYIIETI